MATHIKACDQAVQKTRSQLPSFVDNGGFSMTTLLAALPLGLAILSILATFVISIKAYTQSHHQCRVSTLKTQSKLSDYLQQLLKLNPRASQLRAERRMAEHMLKAAIRSANPKLIAIAQARVLVIKAKQVALGSKQKKLLFQSRLWAQSNGRRLQTHLHKSGLAKNSRWHFSQALAVRPWPTTSLSPDYIVKPNFSEKQKIVARWQIHLKGLVPSWMQKIFKIPSSIKGQCAATINRKDGRWTSSLTTAKY